MFEEYKLTKYANCFVGFAYESLCDKNHDYKIQIYIVADNGNQYQFIKYRKQKSGDLLDINNTINMLMAKPIYYWMNLNIKNQETKQKRLEKHLSRDFKRIK